MTEDSANRVTTLSPSNAREHALHYLRHTTGGWDGYSVDDAAEFATWRMADFLTGELTYERDLKPLCDEWCW